MADFKEILVDGQVYNVKDETARQSAGGGDGTVTAVKMNNGTPIEPDENGVVNLGTVITQHQDISGKVDKETGKGLSTNDYTTADKTKLAGLPTNAELQEALSGIGGGSVETITVGETTYTPDENGDVDLGDLRGQDGNSGVASADGVESVNNLNGGTTDTSQKVYVLGANQGKRIRDQIEYVYGRLQALYSALGNIAFWDGKPNNLMPDLNWNYPKHTITFNLDNVGSHVIVKNGNTTISDGDEVLVEEGTTLVVTVTAESGYAISELASTAGTVDGNEVSIVMGGSNVTLDITATAAEAKSVTLVQKDFDGNTINGALSISKDVVATGGDLSADIDIVDDYFDAFTILSVKDASNNDVTYTFNNGTIEVDNVTSNITITAKVTKTLKIYSNKTLTRQGAVVSDSGGCYTDYIRLDGLSASAALKWYHGFQWTSGDNWAAANNFRCMLFYDKNKKLLYMAENSNSQWNPVGATANADYTRDISTTIVGNAINTAADKTPVYARLSVKMNGTGVVSSAVLSQGNRKFYDQTDVAVTTAPTEHAITYNKTHASCNCETWRANVIDGEDFESLVTVDSTYTLQSVTVTMGGVDITNDVWHPGTITNPNGTTSQGKIIIPSVTGALVITTTAS